MTPDPTLTDEELAEIAARWPRSVAAGTGDVGRLLAALRAKSAEVERLREAALDTLDCLARGDGMRDEMVFSRLAPPLRRAAAADMTRMTNQRPPHPDDLMVECWCQRAWVWMPAADVRAGRTESCGLPRCRPPELVPPTLT